jgi:hypothetical protein
MNPLVEKAFFFYTIFFLLAGSFTILFIPKIWAQEGEETPEEIQPLQQGRDSVRMNVVAVNPSDTKTQVIPVKVYLPAEVTPSDIFNPGGLDIEFDTSSSIYYLYKDGLELKPKETRIYRVELKDVWIIPQERLDALRGQTEAVLKRFEGTEYYENAKKLGDAIYMSLDTIARTQYDDTVSTKRHIGVYRNNLKIVDQIKEDITRLEKQLEITGSLPTPEVLENPNLKVDSPTKTTTWMIILVIMTFIGMIAGVFFLTWHTQAHLTKDVISGARKVAFPKAEENPPPNETPSKNEQG